MIASFRHKGLARLYGRGDRGKVAADHANKIDRILGRLDEAARPADMDIPGYRLHPLKGALKGYWAVGVSGNWRIVFRLERGDAHDVDLMGYH